VCLLVYTDEYGHNARNEFESMCVTFNVIYIRIQIEIYIYLVLKVYTHEQKKNVRHKKAEEILIVTKISTRSLALFVCCTISGRTVKIKLQDYANYVEQKLLRVPDKF